MLRFVPFLVLLLLGAITLPMEPATVVSQSGEVFGVYRNAAEGFSIQLPKGWAGRENQDNFPLLSAEIKDSSYPAFANIWIFPLVDEISAESWFDSQTVQFQPERRHRSRRYSLTGSDSGFQSLDSWVLNDGTTITSLTTVIVRKAQVFQIIVGTLEEFWPYVREQANSFTDSFTLERPIRFGVSPEDSLFQYWGEIISIDPALSRYGPSDIEGAIFSGLVKLNTDMEVVPDIAESWRVSDDLTIYTFTLRDDVRFHDGRPVTAEDFKYSWERALSPALDSPVSYTYLGDIDGADEVIAGRAQGLDGVRALDSRTLEVALKSPIPYFLGKLTYPTSYVVDQTNVETGADWTDAPNGTGAFKLKTWRKDELLILERNNDWYGGMPALAHSVYRIFAGRPMQMYENGEIDLTGVYVWNIDRARDPANPLNSHLRESTRPCTFYLGFNVTKPPFDDPKVRQALALALDVDKQIEVTYRGLDKRAAGFVPPGIPGYNQHLRPTEFDPEAARKLLEASVYGGAENLPPIRSFTSSDAMHWAWEEYLGLEVEDVSIYETSDIWGRLDNKELGVFTSGWCADYPDPQNFLDLLFRSDSPQNEFAYSNDKVDALLTQAAVESNPQSRIDMYQEIEKIVLEDWVAVPLRHDSQFLLVQPYVKGFELVQIGVPQLQNIRIERQR